jgi:diguanylate cyclase (GGDEF)-like protein
VINEETLSAVLREFARTMATDFPIQTILDQLVEHIVAILPITSAGVTLISDTYAPRYIAASDDAALRYEQVQSTLGEGPCIAAYTTGQPVQIPDLSTDDRFPRFAAAGLGAGLGAVFTFPMRHGDGRLGALDLYREQAGVLDVDDMRAAQTLADVAAAYLLNARARADALSTSERFRHNALHDPLTGLPNRLLLQERLEHAAARAKRSHTNAAVIFVDLDHFKAINDLHGHVVGDELLRAVAARLASLVRSGDTLTRYAGDEFVILCEDMTNTYDVEILTERIEGAFDRPFELREHELGISASVGVAFAGPGEEVSEHLLAEADNAMYLAKRANHAHRHRPHVREALRGVRADHIEADLREALARDELELLYQPMVGSGDRIVTGVEALLRWTDPRRGPVSPTAIVAIAERTDLINEIGSWIFERACLDHRMWQREVPGSQLGVSVNVSARQLMSPGFRDTVTSALDSSGVDPRIMALEMTEYVLLEHSTFLSSMLRELQELGIRIALDDFGTGHSSLGYLRNVPIDIVKIDGSFIADIGRVPEGLAVTAAITDLAHSLGLTVTAEAVETRAQSDAVAAIGCDIAQGFFFARPMTAAAISHKLGHHGVGRAAVEDSAARWPSVFAM